MGGGATTSERSTGTPESEHTSSAADRQDTADGLDRAPTADDRSDAAFARLYRDAYPGLARLAFLTMGSQEQADEIVQEAFVRLHLRWGTVEHPEAYLRRTVINECRDLMRRWRRLRERQPKLVAPESSTDTPDELWDALSRLTPRQRGALVLRFYEDMQEAEIADVLGVRVGTVKSLLHRGIEQLRKEIEP